MSDKCSHYRKEGCKSGFPQASFCQGFGPDKPKEHAPLCLYEDLPERFIKLVYFNLESNHER